MDFTDSIDEIVALIMAVGGVAVLLGGLYGICTASCEVAIKDLLLIASALLLPSTGYLFGKSIPKHEENDIKDILLQTIQKQR